MSAPNTRPLKVAIIGAGVMGVTTAYRLSQAGADVTVIDGGELAGGTSGATFAQINASYGGYWDYFDLRRAGVEIYDRMQREDGGAPWWHNIGTLNVYRDGSQAAALDDHLDRLLGVKYPAARVTGPASRIEPALAEIDAERVFHFPTEGYVDVDAMVADLAGRAQRLGAQIRTEDPAVSMVMSGDDVTGVRLRSGATIYCDQVIVCAGTWTDDVLGLAGLETKYVAKDSAGGTPVPGLLIVTDAAENSVNSVVTVDDVAYRPDRHGRTMVWSGMVDGQLLELGGENADPDVPARLAGELLTRAAEFVPVLRDVSMHEAILTTRAMPTDGLPIIGTPPGLNGVYVVLAHAGATLAPAVADLVVDELVHGRQSDVLNRYRPARFASTLT